MRKNIKRLVAVLVVMTMIISMCSTAFAAGHGSKKSSNGSYKSYTKEVTDQATDPVVEESADTAAPEEQAVDETAETTPEETNDVAEDAVEEAADEVVTEDVSEEYDEGSYDYETDNYKVTVSFTEEAKIPVGTELEVSEIPSDSDEYAELWDQSLEKINEDATWSETDETAPDTRRGIASAAFFDISLMYEGEEFEPDVPLQVEINLKDGGLPLFDGQDTEVIHFGNTTASDGGELIDDVQTDTAGALGDGMPEGVSVESVTYEQTGFSPVAVVTTDDYIDFDAAVDGGSFDDANNLTSRMMLAATRAAGDPTINAGKTVTDTDGDGIYELALSVNATSQESSTTQAVKSNIVMVIDVSGSMGNDNSWIYYDTYTYDADTYDDFRYYSSSTNMNTRLYYGDYYRNEGSWMRPNWVLAGTGWYSGNQYGGTAYSGTVYAYETRLHATQRASCAVVDALLQKNTDEGVADLFEITVVKFANKTATNSYNGTETIIKDSTNATAIKNAINALTSGGGTNWQAALEQAKTEADYYKNTDPSRSTDPEENTSVIFLTDGFPTFYGNDNGYGSGWDSEAGQETSNNIALCYSNSRTAARTIVNNGYTLYNIFAFGSDTTTYNNHTGFAYLRALTNYAYGTGDNDNYNETANTRQYAFNAKSTDDLVKAFETIVDHITNNVGYAGVNLSDGVSLGATNTSVAVNGTAKEESMRYTVKDEQGKISHTVSIDKNGVATFTIHNADGTKTTLTDNSAETVTTTINDITITSKVYSVTTGSGDNEKTYKMSPATINANTGMVQWNLAGLGILESGYTYTVAFDVWANQLAYDIAADLNNGLYTTVDAALDAYNVTDATERQHIKDAIVHNDDGSYSLYTNYEQSVDYYPATSSTNDQGQTTWTYGEKQTQNLPHPDPIPLKGSLLPLEKLWESGLSQDELNELLWEDGVVDGTSTEYKITLHIWKADTETELESLINSGNTRNAYISKDLGWDDETGKYVWEKAAAVAPGMMVNIDEAEALGFDITDQSKLKEFTNDQGDTLTYYVIENGHYYYVTEDGSDLHFELDTVLYHPMIVDGTLYNVAFGEGKTVEKMDPMSSVMATNRLKGGLNICKVVSTTQIAVEDGEIANVTEPVDETTGIKTVTDEFTYEIKLWKEDENGNKTAVYTTDDQIKEGGSETISGSIGYRIFSEPSDIDGTGNITYAKQARGAILTEDSQYASLANGIFATIANNVTTITLTMPANGEIRLVNLPAGTKYTVKEIEDTTGNYTYAATKSQVKTEEGISDGTVTTDNEVSGKISGNKASVETYFNCAAHFFVYHSSDNTIEKISFADDRVNGTYNEEDGKYDYKFNIVDETKDTFLYGGYYNAYSGAKMTDAEIIAATYDKGWATDTSATPYDASKANIWKKANAYTDVVKTDGGGTGTEMTPVANEVYYLKEVPNGYIRPYIHYTYDKQREDMPLQKLYVVTAADDTNYDSVGYIVAPSKSMTAAATRSLLITVKKSDGTIDATLTANSIFDSDQMSKYQLEPSAALSRGYLHWSDFSSYIGTGFTFQPCWTTLDKVNVKGLTVRTVNNGTSGNLDNANAIGVTDVAAE